ncbi:hypothetical protein M9Y10_005180 [Tritrichomonas musculus]|uniref:Uncharacterized protein n=1 Tax=Tritrichomonas musculus TaxID=1915356 RepID=A0ABR2JLU6_9EUKA
MPFLLFIFISFYKKEREDPTPVPEKYPLSASLVKNEHDISSSSRSNLNFINKEFIKTLPENKQVYIEKESSISLISGCTFTNIELPNTYIVILDKEVMFFDNNFEFYTFGDYPSPIYLNKSFHGSINISHCKFHRCKSRENGGNVLNCIGKADILFES